MLYRRKLSLSVIRVKYVQDEDLFHNPLMKNGCSPYNDQIMWDPEDIEDIPEAFLHFGQPYHLVKITNCGGKPHYICHRIITWDGTEWIEVGVYARIGAYHIYQSWYLSKEGKIRSRVWSKGLSCNLDHLHHPYRRFHFDLDREHPKMRSGKQTEQVNLKP